MVNSASDCFLFSSEKQTRDSIRKLQKKLVFARHTDVSMSSFSFSFLFKLLGFYAFGTVTLTFVNEMLELQGWCCSKCLALLTPCVSSTGSKKDCSNASLSLSGSVHFLEIGQRQNLV